VENAVLVFAFSAKENLILDDHALDQNLFQSGKNQLECPRMVEVERWFLSMPQTDHR
jgi:hypothetical protein